MVRSLKFGLIEAVLGLMVAIRGLVRAIEGYGRATGDPPIASYGLWCRSTDRWGLMVVAVAQPY